MRTTDRLIEQNKCLQDALVQSNKMLLQCLSKMADVVCLPEGDQIQRVMAEQESGGSVEPVRRMPEPYVPDPMGEPDINVTWDASGPG